MPAALAEIIGIREVLVPIHQGVFSAFGLMTADMRVDESRHRELPLRSHRSRPTSTTSLDRLRQQALAALASEGYAAHRSVEATIEMRYLGQNYSHRHRRSSLAATVHGTPDIEEVYDRFHAEHRRLYGYDIPDEIIEFVNFKADRGRPDREAARRQARPNGHASSPRASATCTSAGRRLDCRRPIYERSTLPAGAALRRPGRDRGGDVHDAPPPRPAPARSTSTAT